MLNTDMSSASPFLLLKPPFPPGLKGIDRLSVIPASVAPSDALTPDVAVARLAQVGLVCGKAPGHRLHILGGTSVFAARGIEGYERPFTILEEQAGGFTAMVAGTRTFPDEEVCVATLAQAVEEILRIYSDRGMLPSGKGLR